MKIIRVQNPVGIDYMKEHFVDLDIDSEVLSEGLKAQLVQDLTNILILQAWEGDDLIAFIVAQNMRSQSHVFLYQAWVDAKSGGDVGDKLFFRLLLWVDLLGKKEIRMETTRNEEAIIRKWGFEKFSSIMSFKIPDDIESDYMSLMKNKDVPNNVTSTKTKEINDGTGQQTKD